MPIGDDGARNDQGQRDVMESSSVDRVSSTSTEDASERLAPVIEGLYEPQQDRWSEAKVLAQRQSNQSADGTSYRLRRIVRHPATRYPILVEEQIRLVSTGGSVASREVVSEKAASHFLLTPRGNASKDTLSDLVTSQGLILGERLSPSGPYRVIVPPSKLTVDSVQAWVADFNSGVFGEVAYADFDFLRRVASVPNDAHYAEGDQWSLSNDGSRTGSVVGMDIGAVEGWKVRTDASNVVVAVVDTGVRYTHEDLEANIWVNTDEVEGNGIDDDGNGYVDDIHGINTLFSAKLAMGGDPMDDHGHGTHVAGTIGAKGNNDVGIAGVAWSVQLMPLKFLSSEGNGLDSDAIKCIDYAIQNGADIINNSWGGKGVNKALADAVSRAHEAGILFVVAAGNGGDNIDVDAYTPAGIDLPNVVTVANHNDAGGLQPSSNFGREKVDVVAPGTRIRSTTFRTDQSYGIKTGTSMAAPHVSGVLALLKAEYPSDNSIKLKERVLQGGVFDDRYAGKIRTASRLNLSRSLQVEAFAPPAVSNTAVSVRGGQASLVWEHDWDEPIDGFRIEKRFGQGEWKAIGFAGPEQRGFGDPDLLPVSDAAYRIVAVNDLGDSLASHNQTFNTVVEEISLVDVVLPEGDKSIGFGSDLDSDRWVLAVGAPQDDDAGQESGSVYIYERIDGSGWQYRQKLIGNDSKSYDKFGYSVSLSESTLAVGAHLEDEGGLDSGAVYLFERGENERWRQTGKIMPADGAPQDKFGFSVDIHGDLLVVSARDDDDSGKNAGSVYVYERSSGGDWVLGTKLVPAPESDGEYFGWSVSARDDRVVVGAKGDDSNGVGSGSVYVYRKSGENWTLEQKLLPDDASAYDGFGTSVDFDGTTIVAGTPNDDSTVFDHGSVSVYRRVGVDWERLETLVPLEPQSGLRMGTNVAVSGSRVAAVGTSADGAPTVGFVFEEQAAGEWHECDAALEVNGVSLKGSGVTIADGVVSVGDPSERLLRSVFDVPESPYEVEADVLPRGGVALSWSMSESNATFLAIERREVGNPDWRLLTTVEAGSTRFVDSAATGGRQWEYRLRSVSGAVSVPSNTVSTALLPKGRLVNLSVRGYVGEGERVLVPGFTVVGSGSLSVALRARGPSLLEHGVPDPIMDPEMTVVPLGQSAIGGNDDWFDDFTAEQMQNLEQETGASPIALYASESVYADALETGVYTAIVENAEGAGGLGLAEIFEVPTEGVYDTGAALVNLSARGFVDSGARVLIGGFVVAGDAPVRVLVRGVGPGLQELGVADVLERPRITVFDVEGVPIVSNESWGMGGQVAEIVEVSTSVGAFALKLGSTDSALLVTLPPGLYTCVLDTVFEDQGVGLVEIYLTP